MTSTSYNWTAFKRQVYINAATSRVFRAWTTAGDITAWFIAEASYVDPAGHTRQPDEVIRAGDRYAWAWHQDLNTSGTILEVIPNELVQFTFGDKETGSPEKIVVTVRLFDEGDQTRVVLVQENMADTPAAHSAWHLACNMGWSFFMTNLKAYLEHGVDLRETDPERAYASRAVNLL